MMSLLDNLFGIQMTPSPLLQGVGSPVPLQAGDPTPIVPNQSVLDAPQPLQSTPQALNSQNVNTAAPVPSDVWRPAQRSWLGRLGDALAGRPIYSNAMNQRDLASAMTGFEDNPAQAIARIAQLPGMAPTAWNMYQQLESNKEKEEALGDQSEARNVRSAVKKLTVADRIGSMAGSLVNNPDAENLWPAMREQMVRTINAFPDEDPDTYGIPENWDPNWAQAASGAAIPAAQQARIQLTKQSQSNAEDYRKQRIELAQQRAQLAQQDAQRKQQIAADSHAKLTNYIQNHTVIPGVADNGLPYKMNGAGNQMVVTHPDGSEYAYVKAGSNNGKAQWKLLGETTESLKRKALLAQQNGQ